MQFFKNNNKKLFVRKEESVNTKYSLRNNVMVDRNKLMTERTKNIDKIIKVNSDTLDNILHKNDINTKM
jgi:hypothetical protein